MAIVRWRRTLTTVLAAGLVAGCDGGTPEAAGVTPRAQAEGLAVATVVAGLEHPWDIGFLPDGRMLLTERPARFQLVGGGTASKVRADLADVFVRGEGGLM